eukprot:UN20122
MEQKMHNSILLTQAENFKERKELKKRLEEINVMKKNLTDLTNSNEKISKEYHTLKNR